MHQKEQGRFYWVAGALVQLLGAMAAFAQPTLITPLDVARSHQFSSVTDDHSQSGLYDVKNPLEIHVRIHHLHVPKEGYATITYTFAQENKDSGVIRRGRSEQYIATLNASSILSGKAFANMDLPKGAMAVLYGWPATEVNVTNSNFLVDELHLLDTGQWFSFHQPQENVSKHNKTMGPRLESR